MPLRPPTQTQSVLTPEERWAPRFLEGRKECGRGCLAVVRARLLLHLPAPAPAPVPALVPAQLPAA